MSQSMADEELAPPRLLLAGESGTGKTGALVSILLTNPKARIFYAEYDKAGRETLKGVCLNDPNTQQPRPNGRELLSRIYPQTFADKIGFVNGIPMVVGVPTAFTDLGNKLNNWGEGLGGLSSWSADDYLVIDSWTALTEGAMRDALQRSGRLNRRPEQSDWGEAVARMNLVLELICDPKTIKANVIIIAHITSVGDPESGVDKQGKPNEIDMFPRALTRNHSREWGRFFNNIVLAKTVGEGPGLQRRIYTRSPGKLELKTSNPAMVKPEYPLDTGLASLLADLRRTGPAVPSAPAATAA